jgi:hypothetical protein
MVKLKQLTTAEAMSHPDVALTINTLGRMADDLRTQNQALREALTKLSHAVHEIHHARTNPRWFTGGEHAAYQHQITWIGKAAEIVANEARAALAEGKDV